MTVPPDDARAACRAALLKYEFPFYRGMVPVDDAAAAMMRAIEATKRAVLMEARCIACNEEAWLPPLIDGDVNRAALAAARGEDR